MPAIERFIGEHAIETVELAVVDTQGAIRGKRIPAAAFRPDARFAMSSGFYCLDYALDVLPAGDYTWASGYPDVFLVPDPGTLRPVPWRPGTALACLADRPGAGCRIEARYPFVDRSVVEFAARLPREWKLSGSGREKHILREAYADMLPPEIRDRPKFGARIPAAEHLLPTGTGDWVDELLTPGRIRGCGVLDEHGVRRLLDRVRSAPDGRIPFPDRHAYLQLLSTLLLQDSLVDHYEVPDVDIDRILLREFDGTGGALVRR